MSTHYIHSYYFVNLNTAVGTSLNVVIPGGMSTFVCQSINSGDIQQFQWLVNGTQLESTEGIRATVQSNIIGILSFNNIPVEYNGTTIQCIVTLTSGETISSNNAALLVQGEP